MHEYRGDVSLVLVSPAGTRSHILSHRHLDSSSDGIDFTFMTVHHWGEDPAGTWTLKVEDHPRHGSSPSPGTENGIVSSGRRRGRLLSWSLVLYGVAGERPNHHSRKNSSDTNHRSPPEDTDSSDKARRVGSSKLKELMEKEEESSDSVHIRSKDEMAEKRNGMRRKWLLKRGFSHEDADFLIALFETEKEERRKSDGDNSAEQKRSEIPSSRGNQHYGRSSKNENSWWRRSYDTGRRSQWSLSKRRIEGNHQRIVDHDAVNGSVDIESLRMLVDELVALVGDD